MASHPDETPRNSHNGRIEMRNFWRKPTYASFEGTQKGYRVTIMEGTKPIASEHFAVTGGLTDRGSKIDAAYAAAKKYSEMLNEVFCYCYCDEDPFNHFTLLSCFATEHGAG